MCPPKFKEPSLGAQYLPWTIALSSQPCCLHVKDISFHLYLWPPLINLQLTPRVEQYSAEAQSLFTPHHWVILQGKSSQGSRHSWVQGACWRGNFHICTAGIWLPCYISLWHLAGALSVAIPLPESCDSLGKWEWNGLIWGQFQKKLFTKYI